MCSRQERATQDPRRQLDLPQQWHPDLACAGNGEAENVESLKLVAAALLSCAIATPALAQGKADAKSGPRYKIGRGRPPDEIRGWDIDVRPDGRGLPRGQGTVTQGEKLFMALLLLPWRVRRRQRSLAGARRREGIADSDNPNKTIGSFWPYASTVLDYIRHAMP